jgi:DNA polymerase III, delta subunit
MIQTNLFLTQTYLQVEDIQAIIAHHFLTQKNFLITANSQKPDSLTWQHYINTGQVVVWSSDKVETDSQKEQFRRFVNSDVWVKYSCPTVLFVGDLTEYSDTLQEGMLKLLEEPPVNLFIVLFAQSLSILKPTIISRSQIHSLPLALILNNLNSTLCEKIKKLPTPKETVTNLLTNKKISVDKVSDYERNELDFWLWQIQTNLSFVYQQDTNDRVAQSISKIMMARKLNYDNLQKKFCLGWLNS